PTGVAGGDARVLRNAWKPVVGKNLSLRGGITSHSDDGFPSVGHVGLTTGDLTRSARSRA
ncbi:MAG: hypothetical protein O3A46_16650, partial [Candidatus Poribacteria bacterium]|nr:hypothetical protein [Candidatus Poribacteria bacterium]